MSMCDFCIVLRFHTRTCECERECECECATFASCEVRAPGAGEQRGQGWWGGGAGLVRRGCVGGVRACLVVEAAAVDGIVGHGEGVDLRSRGEGEDALHRLQIPQLPYQASGPRAGEREEGGEGLVSGPRAGEEARAGERGFSSCECE